MWIMPSMDRQLHEYQISILRELLFKPGARFRDLKKVDVTNDHFTFHVNHLVESGLVVKSDGKYTLSDVGKEFANRMDTDGLVMERQGKLAVGLHAVKVVKGETLYLIHQRLKEPFYGWYGSHTGKIRWGENPDQAAKREFMEETGLSGTFKLNAIVHYHHYHADGRFLEDKYFWTYMITNPKGNLREEVPEGRNIWVTKKEFKKLDHTFATFEEMDEVVSTKKLIYIDRQRTVESY